MTDFPPGCEIEVKHYGPAICIKTRKGSSAFWVHFRYLAERCSDGKLIWVQNAVPRSYCTRTGDPAPETVAVAQFPDKPYLPDARVRKALETKP